MTLLLGALTSEAVVLSADGIEFLHAPGVPKFPGLLNRQKLFHLEDHRIALGIHGQNRLISRGGSLDSQWLLIEALPKRMQELDHDGTVVGFCHSLFNCLMPDVLFTFETLARAGLRTAPLGILVIGFDGTRKQPQCYEAWWPLLNGGGQPQVIEHPKNRQIPAVMHSGDGARYAKDAISHGGRYSVDRLKKTSPTETQQYLRNLYKRAESLQLPDGIEFGGNYHEITVTPKDVKWSVTLQPEPRGAGRAG